MNSIWFRLFPLFILTFGAVVYGINFINPLNTKILTATHTIIGIAFIFYSILKKISQHGF